MTTSYTITVTGASGFIGAHLVKELLAHGYHVRGTVRNLSDPDKYAYLTSLPGASKRLELVTGQLGIEGSYDEAVAGVDYVMHAASPYMLDVKDPQRDLVAPAVQGTKNVLRACKKASTIKRVLVTSSMAAITDEPVPGKIHNEADWNEKSSLTRNPYYYSKVLAEKAAWAFMEENDTSFDLVVLNPYVVIGPALNPTLNGSNFNFQALMTGRFPALVDMSYGYVDVRDVAVLHRLAMETPHASGRYLIAHETRTIIEVLKLLKANGYTKYRYPKLPLTSKFGTVLAKLFSYTENQGIGSFLRTHLGKKMLFDNSKTKKDFGFEYRDMDQTILETVADMAEWGHIPAKT